MRTVQGELNKSLKKFLSLDKVKTVGAGKAFILRDGQRYDAEWSRPSGGSGTAFTVNGAALPFDIGQAWILLVPNDSKGKYSFK